MTDIELNAIAESIKDEQVDYAITEVRIGQMFLDTISSKINTDQIGRFQTDLGYKETMWYLFQTGTDTPTKNDTYDKITTGWDDSVPNWQEVSLFRVSTGKYQIRIRTKNPTVGIQSFRMFVLFGSAGVKVGANGQSGGGGYTWAYTEFTTHDDTGALADGILNNTSVLIRLLNP